MLAAIGVGLFKDAEDATKMVKIQDRFRATIDASERERRLAEWHNSIRRARGQAIESPLA